MDSYITIKEYATFTFEDRKSVFIGHAMPIKAESEAIEFIGAVKKKYPDARHWVYAYVLRENSMMRYSDDREPQGTAGMPVLDVIRKNGCTDVVIVVVRYFGGTLLGTGGLVHAYTAAALGALKSGGIVEFNMFSEINIEVGYSDYQKLGSIFAELDFLPTNTEYLENVSITGTVRSESCDELEKKLREASSGRCKITKTSEFFDFR
jgi:uncharacterized YigZ family protein